MTNPVSTGTPAAAPGGARQKLSGAYWRLWTASSISNIGDGVFAAALPLLAARITRDPTAVAAVSVFTSLPWLILSLPAGAIVDRADRRRLMGVADLFRAVLVGGLAVAAATGHVSIWLLCLVGLGLGVAEVLFDNASQAIVPAIVPPELLEKANGWRYAAEITGNAFIGTPLGPLFLTIAVALPFGVDAASFVMASLLVLSLRGNFRPERSPETTSTLRAEIKEGLHWLWHRPLLRSLAIALGLSNLGFQMGQAIFVLFATEELGVSERGFGVLLACMAGGAILGGLLGDRIVTRIGKAPSIIGALSVWICTMIGTGLAPHAWVVAVTATIESLAATVWNVVTVSLRQEIVPQQLFGRVNSVYRWFGWGGIPIGGLLGGIVAVHFGLRAPFFVGAAVVAVALVVALPHVTPQALDDALRESAASP